MRTSQGSAPSSRAEARVARVRVCPDARAGCTSGGGLGVERRWALLHRAGSKPALPGLVYVSVPGAVARRAVALGSNAVGPCSIEPGRSPRCPNSCMSRPPGRPRVPGWLPVELREAVPPRARPKPVLPGFVYVPTLGAAACPRGWPPRRTPRGRAVPSQAEGRVARARVCPDPRGGHMSLPRLGAERRKALLPDAELMPALSEPVNAPTVGAVACPSRGSAQNVAGLCCLSRSWSPRCPNSGMSRQAEASVPVQSELRASLAMPGVEAHRRRDL